MKKIALLLSLSAITLAANAQLTLTGTSYTQNFDALGTGSGSTIPLTGWYAYSGATSSSLGTIDVTFGPTTTWGVWGNDNGTDTLTGACASDVFGHGFKNCASNDAGAAITSMGCAAQEAVSNRAFGVRQASNTTYPGFDPGPAFELELTNTSGRTAFNLTFNLESLDTLSPRVTTWTVDYGFGASPSLFTPATATGTMTTGGNTFSNNAITVNFGSALNNQSGPVWIRIVTLAATTGSGSRTTSAIDDFHLTWTNSTTGITNVSAQPELSLTAIGMATNDKITLSYNADEAGNYNLSIYDLTGRVIRNQGVNAQAGTQQISVDGLRLAPGMYIAKMSNGNSSSVARVIVQ